MSKNLFIGSIVLFSCSLGLYSLYKKDKSTSPKASIAIVLPCQHTALDSIVRGIQKTIAENKDIGKIKVFNANGDNSELRMIYNQIQRDKYAYVFTVGTSTTLTALAILKDTTQIIGVAAEIDPDTLSAKKELKNLHVVSDNVEVEQVLAFIKKMFPKRITIGLLYSDSEKIYPEIIAAKKYAKAKGLKLSLKKVSSIQEVNLLAPSLIQSCDVVVVLKDHLVVRNMAALSYMAKKNNTLLVCMDDGSVQEGAHFGIGVPEEDIGIAAGELLSQLLAGEEKEQHIVFNALTLFYNQESMEGQKIFPLEKLKKLAKRNNYRIIRIETKKK